MKTIKLQTAEIKEILIVPQKTISILYQVSDDIGNVIINNRISINKSDLPISGQNAMDNLSEKLLDKVIAKEL